jgi:hypothetical protein
MDKEVAEVIRKQRKKGKGGNKEKVCNRFS